MSHTKKDVDFCTKFDVVSARVGLRVFRSEFEAISTPAWNTIRDAMRNSIAMFLLVGEELVKNQTESSLNSEANWKFTQNWISYEVGLACQLGIDVWVLCDNVSINFPIPYLNNYDIRGIEYDDFWWLRDRLENYSKKLTYPVGWNDDFTFLCPFDSCGSIFNFHSVIPKNESIICPTCLREITLENGWLLD
jgi:hypothetical protein